MKKIFFTLGVMAVTAMLYIALTAKFDPRFTEGNVIHYLQTER